MKGRVTWWDNSNNCGFVEINNEEVFVHSSGDINIYENELIEFSLIEKNNGLFICNLKEICV